MRGGGGGAEGLTVGQTTAGGWTVSGAGGGGLVASFGASISAFGPGRVGLALGVARTACTFLINPRPKDKRMSLVRALIKKARLTRAEIAKAMANPNVNPSPLPRAPISSADCIKIIYLTNVLNRTKLYYNHFYSFITFESKR